MKIQMNKGEWFRGITLKRKIRFFKIERYRYIVGLLLLDLALITLVILLVSSLVTTKNITINNDTVVSSESENTVVLDDEDAEEDSESLAEMVQVSSVGNIQNKIKQAFPEEPEVALAVAYCESRFDPMRIGDTHLAKPSVGVFQINQIWHKYETDYLQNPDNNIEVARGIYDRSGGNFMRWTCFKQDLYKQYLAKI